MKRCGCVFAAALDIFRPYTSSLRCREKTRASRSDSFPGGRFAAVVWYPKNLQCAYREDTTTAFHMEKRKRERKKDYGR
ncbi:MAG: hypothetical protein A2X92_04800 [Syntrophus sp. GWC2_56_31]|nr:MAG: hypothetical protein A2X92_04800 [Syntrophus sp. GWC2_56_31]